MMPLSSGRTRTKLSTSGFMESPRWLQIALPGVVVAVLSAGTAYYWAEGGQYRRRVEAELTAVARLKAEQVAQWRRERFEEGLDLMHRPLLAERLAAWISTRKPEAARQLLAEFELLREYNAWARVHLVDPSGDTLLGIDPPAAMHVPTREVLGGALRERRPILVDLHTGVSDPEPHINLVVPVSPGGPDGRSAPVVGALVLTARARDGLYPLLEAWPTPSATAETLLVRREGDEVVVLNDLRGRSGSALTLRLPVSRGDLPAVKAALGATGIVEGPDYRGIPVIAAVVPVPETPWFLVAKMDRSEALAEWRTLSLVILAFVGGMVALAAVSALMLRQHFRQAYYRDLYQAESARLAVERRFHTILDSLAEAVVSTDVEGRVESLNPAAESLTGWSEDEARGRKAEEVVPLLDAKTRRPLRNPVHRALQEGSATTISEGTLLVDRQGTEHPIADGAAPIRDEAGNVTGAVLVVRDQTREREAEEAALFAHALLDNSQDPVYCVDPSQGFRLVYVNDAACRHFGRSREELLKMTPLDFDPSMTLERLQASWESRSDRPFRFETLHRNADGRLLPVEIMAGVFEYGGRHLSVESIRDISELKAAAAALAESEERHRRLAEQAPDLVFRYEFVPTRRFSYVSPSATAITGYTPEEHYADPDLVLKIIHPEDRLRLEEILRRPERAKEPFTLRWIRRDGRVIYMEQRSVLVFDELGRLAALEGIARDVTDRQQVEESLRQSETRYRQLFEAHPLPMWVYDLETLRFLAVNSAAIQLYGYTREEFLAMTIRDIRPEEEISRLDDAVAYAREHHSYMQSSGWRHRTRDGRVFEVEIWSHPITFEGRAGRAVAVIDVSERKRLEALLLQAQKMESVGRLAGGVAHDFNNMLGVILGNVELALDSDLPPEMRDYLEEIQAAARRSAELTRQLLAFARRQTVSPKVLDLNETVGGMLRMLRRLIGEDIDLVWMPGADLWPVLIDPAQVDQILANLCVNARDAIADVGKVTIETENRLLDEAYCAANPGFMPGAYVQLSVSDDGCGMTEETLRHVFEPFFTTKPPGEGTGLGLSTVYGIVRQNDGFVNVYSEPGKGTTIKIYLPRYAGTETVSVPARPSPAAGRGEVVLLVEDEAAMLRVSRRILENLGYRVLPADSATEAIRLAETAPAPIDVLITDVVMPEMNGRELAERIQILHPGIRCLFMSGYTANVIARQSVLKPGVHFLQKPFNQTELAAKLREVIEGVNRGDGSSGGPDGGEENQE